MNNVNKMLIIFCMLMVVFYIFKRNYIKRMQSDWLKYDEFIVVSDTSGELYKIYSGNWTHIEKVK